MTDGVGTQENVLQTIADVDCRAILAAADTPRTVAELVDQCEIPTATAYRKINELVEVGLLEEHTRISSNGRNPSEYRLRTQTVQVDVTKSGRLDVTCSAAPRSENTTRNDSGPLKVLPAPREQEAAADEDGDGGRRRALSVEATGDGPLGENRHETPENERQFDENETRYPDSS